MTKTKLDLIKGTLEILILQTLLKAGKMHGYGIARHIEYVSGNLVMLNQGTMHAALVRLHKRSYIGVEDGISDNGRRAKFYAITRAGRTQLASDLTQWSRISAIIGYMTISPTAHC
jgi:PadR family transcriptional regulator PadR